MENPKQQETLVPNPNPSVFILTRLDFKGSSIQGVFKNKETAISSIDSTWENMGNDTWRNKKANYLLLEEWNLQ